MDHRIVNVIERGDSIPSVPQIVTRLIEITRDENFKIQDVISLMSTDAGIAADVLRLANSPLFGVTREISSLTHATNLLGIKRIITLVMGRCMVSQIGRGDTGVIDLSYYWRRSLATGVLSARFATQVAPKFREEAFMTGLLSDVGVIVLSRALPKEYAPAAEAYAPRKGNDHLQAEKDAVQATHSEVSALVLERWALPEVMVTAILHHHDRPVPNDVPEDVANLTRAVDGASAIARILCEAPDAETVADTCEAAMDVVGLNLSVLEHVLPEIENDIAEFAGVLKIDVISSRVYEIIAKTITDRLAMAAS